LGGETKEGRREEEREREGRQTVGGERGMELRWSEAHLFVASIT
jgi:hypothetical protein